MLTKRQNLIYNKSCFITSHSVSFFCTSLPLHFAFFGVVVRIQQRPCFKFMGLQYNYRAGVVPSHKSHCLPITVIYESVKRIGMCCCKCLQRNGHCQRPPFAVVVVFDWNYWLASMIIITPIGFRKKPKLFLHFFWLKNALFFGQHLKLKSISIESTWVIRRA